MLKLESLILMIFKALLMHNGKLFMKNYKKFTMLEPILSYPSFLLEIQLPNGLLIEESFVQAEQQVRILLELQKQLELYCKPQLIMYSLMCLELVEDSKRNKQVLKDTIYLNNAQAYFIHYIDKICNNNLKRWCLAIH